MKSRFKAMTVQPQGAEKEAGTSSLLLVLVESCAHPVCPLLLTELETETYRPQATTLPTKPRVTSPAGTGSGVSAVTARGPEHDRTDQPALED